MTLKLVEKRLSKMRKYELEALVKELLQVIDDINKNLEEIETRLTAGGL